MIHPPSQLRLVTLSEWERRLVPSLTLTEEDRRLVDAISQSDDCRLSIDELVTGLRICARSWVGVVRFSSFKIQIVPKLAGGHLGLVELIDFTSGLNCLVRHPAVRSFESAGSSLLDLIALLFVESCEALVRGGLLADYREVEDELPVLRGRLRVREQVLERFGRIDRLACRYDEQITNIQENQLLLAALTVCSRFVRHPALSLRVRRMHNLLAEACSLDEVDLRAMRSELVYNRLNEPYREPHSLAWLLLDAMGIDDLFNIGSPRILTEPLVQYTLEPLVYIGPAEGKPKDQWTLRSAGELLDLKICDLACGSGSILLAAGRYMSERLLEAWDLAEKVLPAGTPGITPEGAPSTGKPGEMLIPKDPDERMAYARRLVAQRCLYGVDINPLAVEMAKLSLWLWTLAKDKPFTFLDHAIRCGDSLLGIHDLKQLKTFSLDGTGQQYVFGEVSLDELVDKAIELRLKIESMPSNTVEDIDAQARLMAECDQQTEFLKCATDMLIAAELKGSTAREKLENRDHAAVQIGHYLKNGKNGEFRATATKELARRRFHWPLDFPEIVTKRGGFDAFIGNPPFMVAFKVAPTLGEDFGRWLKARWSHEKGRADLVGYFVLQASGLLREGGAAGLLTTKAIFQEDNRRVTLDHLRTGESTTVRIADYCGLAT